jgi:hypothetical protein
MAASAAALTYTPVFKASIGGRFLTETVLSISAEAEEYKAKGIAVDVTKLGLPDGLVDLTYCKLFLDEKSEKAYKCQIIKGKLVIYQTGAEKKYAVELTEAEGKSLKGFTVRVIAIGV